MAVAQPLFPAAQHNLLVPVAWKRTGEDPNTLEGYASTFGNTDLVGDIVARGAFRKTVRERVPTGEVKLLADHASTTRDVLGTIVDAREDDHGLWIKAMLSAAPSAQDIRIKMLEGHLDRLSIGYTPVRWRFDTDPDTGEDVRVLEEIKLFEASVVVFPANPAAVINRVKSAVTAVHQAGATTAGLAPVREHLQAALDLLTADGTEVRAALGPHGTATSTGGWDAAAQVARIPDDAAAGTLRRMYAWQDPDADPDTKTAYKLPHHDVDQDGAVGAANVTACQAGIAALNGARGGVDIPDADRPGVWRHLAGHLRDAGLEPADLRTTSDRQQNSVPTTTEDKSGDSRDPHPGTPVTHADSAEPTTASSLTLHRLRTAALLAGRDPDQVATPEQVAGVDAVLDAWENHILPDLATSANHAPTASTAFSDSRDP